MIMLKTSPPLGSRCIKRRDSLGKSGPNGSSTSVVGSRVTKPVWLLVVEDGTAWKSAFPLADTTRITASPCRPPNWPKAKGTPKKPDKMTKAATRMFARTPYLEFYFSDFEVYPGRP